MNYQNELLLHEEQLYEMIHTVLLDKVQLAVDRRRNRCREFPAQELNNEIHSQSRGVALKL